MIKQKLQLIHIPWEICPCISQPHYDLCTLEKCPENIGCILTDKEGTKLIRKWIKKHNADIEEKENREKIKNDWHDPQSPYYVDGIDK